MIVLYTARVAITLLIVSLHALTAKASKNVGDINTEPELESRIVGGSQTSENQYPFAVSLVFSSSHFCGGSLIAPDIVLTAGHCGGVGGDISVEIGRHNRQDFFETYESIDVDREIPHPSYSDGESLRYDQMLLLLATPSSSPPVRVNLDETLPGANQEVTVMGWGLQDPDDNNSVSPALLQAQVTTLSNDECDDSKNPNFGFSSYRGQIFPDMLCAYADGKDSCQGDSGGPLIMETSEGNLQVGVVSWGYGCAEPYFPGVYSRPSYVAEWLTSTVCLFSNNPPAYFGCDGGGSPIPAPVSTPTPRPSNAVVPPGFLEAVLTIQVDAYPKEIGWRLDRIGLSTETVAQRTPGVYTTADALISETLLLEESVIYTFTIFDVYEDGICCDHGNGNYRLDIEERLIFDGDGDFKGGRDHTFIASEEEVSTPPPAPLVAGELFLELQIQFDPFPEENGWILRLNEGSSTRQSEVVAFKPARAYASTLANQLITEIIPIPQPGEYSFYFLDSFGDGLCCEYERGYYRLYEGPIANDKLVASGDSEGSSRESTTFTIAGNSDESNPPALQISPTVSPAPTAEPVNVYLLIQSDNFPEDVSWKIEDDKGMTVHSRLPGYLTSKTEFTETLSLESGSLYTFTITDELGDGLCCDNGAGFYSLKTVNGLVASGAKFRGSESIVFSTPGTLPVSLTMQLDEYPAETSWQLERLDLSQTAIVSEIEVQTYDTPFDVIKADFLVAKEGFYRLVVSDSKSDGICCRFGEGYIDLSVDGRAVADKEPGKFATSTTFHFKGDTSLPSIVKSRKLRLSITFDSYPEEVSWILFQNDVYTGIATERTGLRHDTAQIVAYGPTDAYYPRSLSKTTLDITIEVEEISAGSTQSFSFIMLDSAGDGLCCAFGIGKYTLYDDAESVALSGNGAGKELEAKNFTLTHEGVAFDPSPAPMNSGTSMPLLNTCVFAALVAAWGMCLL